MNWFIVIGVVVVILGIYLLYLYFQNYTTVASNLVNLNNANPSVAITNNPNSYQYSVGAWVYVNSWNNNVTKPILAIPGQFNLYLDTTSPTLYFDISQNCAGGSATPSPPMIVTDNFPLQRWTYITVVVDNYFVDMYVDGKLLQSMKLNCMQSVPSTTTASIYLGGSPTVINDVMMTKVYRWSYVLAPQDVWKNYIGGNGVSTSFSSYGMAVDIMKNNQVQNQFRVF
jgi:Concanavalin A-like lectin/glucanases superfamily